MSSLVTMNSNNEQFINMIKAAYETRKTNRSNWEAHWQDIADLMHPFDDNFLSKEAPGTDKMTYIFDSTPIHANQLLSAGLFSMATSSAQKWFDVQMMNDMLNNIREVRMWLDQVSHIMYFEINKPIAHFNTSMHELYLEYGAFGTGVLYVTETLDGRNLRFQALPLSESYLSEGANGVMDSLFRKYPRSVRQLIAKFGIESVSEGTQKLFAEHKTDEIVECVHCIVPPSDYGINVPFPYISTYIDLKHKHIMAGNIFRELPFMAPRFYKNPWEQYGRGPGSTALPDIKMLMEIMRTTIRAAQKATDPPMAVPDETFLNPIRTTPGGINFYRPGTGDRAESMNFGSRPDIGYDVVNDLRGRIREIFFIDQLQLQEGPQMTATEVLQRTEEKLRLMGPLMGRLQCELLGPLLTRVFGLLYRQGKLPQPPPMIEGQEFKITYTSPIARAQEQTEANGIMRSLQILTPFMEMDPQLIDNFDGDQIAKGVFDMYSVRPKFLRSEKAKQAIREQRAEAEEGQRNASGMQSMGQGLEAVTRAGLNIKEAQRAPE